MIELVVQTTIAVLLLVLTVLGTVMLTRPRGRKYDDPDPPIPPEPVPPRPWKRSNEEGIFEEEQPHSSEARTVLHLLDYIGCAMRVQMDAENKRYKKLLEFQQGLNAQLRPNGGVGRPWKGPQPDGTFDAPLPKSSEAKRLWDQLDYIGCATRVQIEAENIRYQHIRFLLGELGAGDESDGERGKRRKPATGTESRSDA